MKVLCFPNGAPWTVPIVTTDPLQPELRDWSPTMSKEQTSSFKSWFEENLKEQSADIARHGADSGFPHITYTSDTVQLFDRFGDEIWQMAVEEAEQMGCNVATFIGGFKRADMLDSLDQFKNLMVWFACEYCARELNPDL